MSFFLVSTQMMPINDLMVEEDRNQFVPLIGRAQSEGSIDSSVTAKLITPQIIGHQPPQSLEHPSSFICCLTSILLHISTWSLLWPSSSEIFHIPYLTRNVSLLHILSQSYQVKDTHCKCLQGITGTLQGNWSAGISNLWGLHVYPQSL